MTLRKFLDLCENYDETQIAIFVGKNINDEFGSFCAKEIYKGTLLSLLEIENNYKDVLEKPVRGWALYEEKNKNKGYTINISILAPEIFNSVRKE